MLAKLAIAVLVGFLMGSWMHAAALVVLLVIWTQLHEAEGPPVLKLAMTSQWTQVSVGLFFSRLTGQSFEVMRLPAYETTIFMGLGCVLAMTVGLIAGIRFADARLRDPGERTSELVTFNSVVIAYSISLLVTSVLTELSFEMTAIRQVLLVISTGRLAIVALLMRRLMHPVPQWPLVLALLTFEVALGFTGYFSGFKEPVLVFVLILMERFDHRRVGQWVAMGSALAALLLALTMWMGVRDEYRREFDDSLYAESRSVRLDRMQALFTDWLDSRNSKRGSDLYALVDRFWVVYYPALALDRVPRIQPHTEGALMGAALLHAVTPRFLFPDKAELVNDSELVRKYSGVWVAGTEEGTSIAFGYAAEGFVDFGMPLMFLPVLVFGLAAGGAYVYLLRLIHHRELAIAVIICIFWYNLYLFERAWSKMLGTTIAMMLYLGGISFLIDRYALNARNSRAQPMSGAPAYPDR